MQRSGACRSGPRFRTGGWRRSRRGPSSCSYRRREHREGDSSAVRRGYSRKERRSGVRGSNHILLDGSGENSECFDLGLQDRLRVLVAQPLLDHRGVNSTEIRSHFQIAVLVQILQARMPATEASLDCPPHNKHGTSRAVVGAAPLIPYLVQPAQAPSKVLSVRAEANANNFIASNLVLGVADTL
jgi:hypothetical protein